MTKSINYQNTDSQFVNENSTEGCELSLSADRQWLRLILSGKQVASFHVNYANKVLGNLEKSIQSNVVLKDNESSTNI